MSRFKFFHFSDKARLIYRAGVITTNNISESMFPEINKEIAYGNMVVLSKQRLIKYR